MSLLILQASAFITVMLWPISIMLFFIYVILPEKFYKGFYNACYNWVDRSLDMGICGLLIWNFPYVIKNFQRHVMGVPSGYQAITQTVLSINLIMIIITVIWAIITTTIYLNKIPNKKLGQKKTPLIWS